MDRNPSPARKMLATSPDGRGEGEASVAFTDQPNLIVLQPPPLLRRLQQRDVVGDRRTAHVEDAGELGVLDLHAFRRLTQ